MQGCFSFIILHYGDVWRKLDICRNHVTSDRWISSKEMKGGKSWFVIGSSSCFIAMILLDILLDGVSCDRWIPAEVVQMIVTVSDYLVLLRLRCIFISSVRRPSHPYITLHSIPCKLFGILMILNDEHSTKTSTPICAIVDGM